MFGAAGGLEALGRQGDHAASAQGRRDAQHQLHRHAKGHAGRPPPGPRGGFIGTRDRPWTEGGFSAAWERAYAASGLTEDLALPRPPRDCCHHARGGRLQHGGDRDDRRACAWIGGQDPRALSLKDEGASRKRNQEAELTHHPVERLSGPPIDGFLSVRPLSGGRSACRLHHACRKILLRRRPICRLGLCLAGHSNHPRISCHLVLPLPRPEPTRTNRLDRGNPSTTIRVPTRMTPLQHSLGRRLPSLVPEERSLDDSSFRQS